MFNTKSNSSVWWILHVNFAEQEINIPMEMSILWIYMCVGTARYSWSPWGKGVAFIRSTPWLWTSSLHDIAATSVPCLYNVFVLTKLSRRSKLRRIYQYGYRDELWIFRLRYRTSISFTLIVYRHNISRLESTFLGIFHNTVRAP